MSVERSEAPPRSPGNWSKIFAWRSGAVLTLSSRGGPAEMLKVSQPRQLADGVTLSPARMLLEILAIYETFGEPSRNRRQFGLLISDRMLDDRRRAHSAE